MGLGRILSGLLGAAVGFTFGGPLAALQGFAQGYLLAAAFEDTKLPPGPRLQDLKANDSTYGTVIPRLYGTDKLTSNVIWMEGNSLKETAEEVVVQKGIFSDTTRLEYSYFATIAVALCEGEIEGINKIYANDEIIYSDDLNQSGKSILFNSSSDGAIEIKDSTLLLTEFSQDLASATTPAAALLQLSDINTKIRVYKGTYSQLPDPAIVRELGEDTSAFRGIAYIVFENLPLSNERFRNSIPKLAFETTRVKTNISDEQGNPRTFAATYTPKLSTGEEYTGPDLNTVSLSVNEQSSVVFDKDEGTSFTVGPSSFYEVITYAHTNGYCFTMQHLDSSIVYSEKVNIVYNLTNGTTISNLNQDYYPYLFKVHDISELSANTQLDPVAANPLSFGKLVREQVVNLYPFDVGLTGFDNTSVAVRPIQNLPNWVVVFVDSELFIGTIVGDRFMLFNTRLNLNEEFNNQITTAKFPGDNYKDSDAGRIRFASNINYNACLLGGMVYVHCSPISDAVEGNFFPGVISVDISNLRDIFSPVPALRVPARTIPVNTGVTSFISDTSVDSLVVNGIFLNNPGAGDLGVGRVTWNKDWIFNQLAYDYENSRLYGIARTVHPHSPIGEQAGFIADLYSTNPRIRQQEVNFLYRLHPITMANEPHPTEGYVSPIKLTNTLYEAAPACARYYPGILDLGHTLLRVEDDINNSTMIPTNSETEFTSDSSLSSFDGPGVEIEGVGRKMVHLLPLSLIQNDAFASVYCPAGIAGATTTVPSFRSSVNPNGIQKQIITLNGSISELFSATPGIEIGEVLAAELNRTGKIDLNTDIDFSQLTDIVTGISIKDRGPIASVSKALQDGYIFDLVEEDYLIRAKLRSQSTIRRVIDAGDLGAHEQGSPVSEVKLVVPARNEVPSLYYLSYRSVALGYEPDTVVWQDPSAEGNITLDIKVPIAVTQNEAVTLIKRIALSTISARVGTVEISTSFKHSDLEVGDFISVILSDGATYTVRILQLDKGRPGLVKMTAIVDDPINYSYLEEGYLSQQTDTIIARTTPNLVVIDSLPFLQNEDAGRGAAYWVGSYSPIGASVISSIVALASVPPGEQLSQDRSMVNITPVGYCENFLGPVLTEGQFDYREELTFNILSNETGFTTLTEEEVLADYYTNTYFYGDDGSYEIIKVLEFIDNNDGTVTARGILRGYKGTSHFGNHKNGDRLIGANVGSLKRIILTEAAIGNPANIKLLNGNSALDATENVQVERGTRLPLPPVNITGYKQDDSSFYMEWVRQARYNTDWVNTYDIALDEESEEYTLHVLDPLTNQILNSITILDNNTTVTLAAQVSIFGAEVSTLTFAVAQRAPSLNLDGFLSEITTI